MIKYPAATTAPSRVTTNNAMSALPRNQPVLQKTAFQNSAETSASGM